MAFPQHNPLKKKKKKNVVHPLVYLRNDHEKIIPPAFLCICPFLIELERSLSSQPAVSPKIQ